MRCNFSRYEVSANMGHNFYFRFHANADQTQSKWKHQELEILKTGKYLGIKIAGLTSNFLSMSTLQVQSMLNRVEYELKTSINK
jgi:hypothetical protein